MNSHSCTVEYWNKLVVHPMKKDNDVTFINPIHQSHQNHQIE